MVAAAPPVSLRAPAVREYAEDVVAGREIAGPWVRLACQRHLDDLEHARERGFRFDEELADRALEFFDYLCLFEGEFAGEPFRLQPWQAFIVGSIFGWVRASNRRRRYQTAYVEIGKGNGKTPMAAAVGLYGLVVDGEASAEIYCAATKAEQAGLLFRDAKRMAEASPGLAKHVDVLEHNLACPRSGSYMRVVSKDSRGLDGKRVHFVLVDELHEHPNNLVVSKMTAGFKGRRQPLALEITNSGYDRTSVCWEHHALSVAILEGRAVNDDWFAYVCALDEGDDWQNPDVWKKANPNLGVSIPESYLEKQVQAALQRPSEQNIVRRLNFCEWTEGETRWLPMDRWDACAGPIGWRDLPAAMRGRRCFAGLDLASTSDLTALVLLFPDDDGDYDIVPFAWCPRDVARERSRKSGVPYDVWEREGALLTTPGNVIDYGAVLRVLADVTADYDVQDLGYDRWGATKLEQDLIELGFSDRPGSRRMTPLGQGYATLSAPSKELEVLVATGRIRHGGHPVLRWAASNVVVEEDAAGNIKPSKHKSSEKIDPIAALVNALERAMGDEGGSVYESHDLLVLG